MFQTNIDLIPWVQEILENVTPITKNQETLNLLSSREIIDSAYIENELVGSAFDSNFLVPRHLYALKLNQVWRYPPHIYFEFLAQISKEPKLQLKIRYAIPRFIRYGEKRYVAGDKRSAVRTFNQITTPTVNLPNDFGTVELFGRSYNLTYDGEFKPKTIKPKLMEHIITLPIESLLADNIHEEILLDSEEQKIIIKKYDANTDTTQNSNQNSPEDLGVEPTSKCEPTETAVGFIQMITGETKTKLIVEVYKTEKPDIVKICVTFLNDNPYNKPIPRKLEWSSRCVILPHVISNLANGEPLLPIQQHHDSLQYTIKNGESALANLYEKLTYINTNGVLTRSVRNKNTLYFSTFGVFDTIREIPVAGPDVELLLENNETLLENLTLLTKQEKEILISKNYLPILKSVLSAAVKAFQVTKYIHKFQWDAIQNRIKLIVNGDKGSTTIIKAPTGSGKTLVFMVNAVLHSIITKERSVLVFPTRILNQDMFQRLTKFVFEIRKLLPNENITGGIFIGISDPLYRALVNPVLGKKMVQYDSCPNCGEKSSIIAIEHGIRKIGKCNCGHEISYMFDPHEVPDYLPLITIATPDNLFYTSTCGRYENYPMRFFGGYYVNCKCEYKMPVMDEKEKSVKCKKCANDLNISEKQSSPIGYFVFDEVHSLYGLTGILLSIYLRSINIVANKIQDWYYKEPLKWQITFETGTATIANEIELLKYITRVPDDKIKVVPNTKDYSEYFKANTDLVKYRTIAMLPIAKASRTSMSNSILRTFHALYHDDEFKETIRDKAKDAYDFILGYLYRKSDGYTIRKTLQEMSGQQFGQEKPIEFLSGDASTPTVSRIFQMAINKEIEILLANMVISLGLDIGNLNNMIMMGMPKSMTEFVQTAGRTGRKDHPGHVAIHLLPSVPRDIFVYENFHRIFSDVSGYYEMKPIQSTNAYAAKLIFPNILKFLINAFSYYQYMLTIPSINKGLRNATIQNTLLLEVLKCLRDEANTPESINRTISNQTKQQFEDFIAEWSKRSGPGLYLSNWFIEEGRSLTSLRARTNKEIQVHVDDTNLFNTISQQVKPPWMTFPEEELDEVESDDNE